MKIIGFILIIPWFLLFIIPLHVWRGMKEGFLFAQAICDESFDRG
jgi:hypothetical protein